MRFNKLSKNYILLLLIFIFLISIINTNAVGIRRFSYDIPRYDFEPGLGFQVNYELLKPQNDVQITLTGELAKFATLSRDKILFTDKDKKFNLKVKIPYGTKSEEFAPGKNIISISVQEINLGSSDQMFVVKTGAISPIVINIPFPGYYAEISEFELPYVNSGEDTKLDFIIWNRGKNDLLDTNYEFTIYDNSQELLKSTKENINIPYQERKSFIINPVQTSTFQPGNYNTTLKYFYRDKMIKKDSLLKIGYLNVEIINHTQKLYNDSIQKFDINIRSDWNDEIKNVYAFIDINGSTAKTTPANLQNFEEKILTAYIDTTSIPVGNHTVNMSLFYEDKTTSESSLIEIIERPLIKEKLDINWTIVLLVVIIILLVITTIFFMFTFMKNNKPKKEKIHKNNKDSK